MKQDKKETSRAPVERFVMRDDALALYSPPFRYEHGFIFDAQNNVVADEPGGHYGEDAALRIRGWGRISYKPDPDKLQDAVGELIAQAMTEFWKREGGSFLSKAPPG